MTTTGDLAERLRSVRLLALDVDGVLTDGGIYFDSSGGEQKRFCVADGLGIVLLRSAGVETAWITGRRSSIVERRAAELGVLAVLQDVRNKRTALLDLAGDRSYALAEVAYVGDELNDLPAFDAAGMRIAVAGAAPELLARADLVTTRPGGSGAVREVCDRLIDARGARERCVAAYLETLCSPAKLPGAHSG